MIVENKISNDDAVFITAPAPIFSPNGVNTESIAKALRIDLDEINNGYPATIVNAGLETLIVPIKSLNGILSILYEPIIRVLIARGYIVRCEVPCPGIQ